MKKIIMIGCVLLLSACGASSKLVKVNSPGYTADVDVYSEPDSKKR